MALYQALQGLQGCAGLKPAGVQAELAALHCPQRRQRIQAPGRYRTLTIGEIGHPHLSLVSSGGLDKARRRPGMQAMGILQPDGDRTVS